MSVQRVVRMWHKRGQEWCHAWDVDEAHHRLWKSGKGPLSAAAVILPDGSHPPLGSQVVCGTCRSQHLVPREMRSEIVMKNAQGDADM